MSGAKAALDTNVVIDILSNDSRAIAWAREFPEIYLPVPVLGELRFGALNCLEHRLPLATRDKHFEEIEELRIELPEI